MKINVEISLGELMDKLSILLIKEKNITDAEKLTHVRKEQAVLQRIYEELSLSDSQQFLEQLLDVNQELWKIEDDIREKERNRQFDEEFIQLARSVYLTNDRRFEIKNSINNRYGSGLKEVKSYEEY